MIHGNGKITLPGRRAAIMDQLQDPDVLKESMMGCRKLTELEKNKYQAELEIGVPGVKGVYEAVLTIEEGEYPKRCQMLVQGEGKPGSVEAAGEIKLTSRKNGETLLHYSYTASVQGTVASLGKPVLNGAAKVIINDFFKKAKKEIVKDQKENSS
ncbi:CoxG family protein [Alkalicoccus daliensis]|uniref:Carbon monoxide dehydrogenase n=1 Tax=Alkalicoccus daliensis TaxID=745820 RepID=A0A1H0F5M4_9BACI|nr:SRPBCC domain-containing protein [Alkalicoccus daliensis]SDN89882.1 hypothetical protein SAMN04488053_104197 [Alkalicoccus daliensis]